MEYLLWKKMNVIVIFDKNLEKTLMRKRTKEPYIGMYNLVGGKIEKRKGWIKWSIWGVRIINKYKKIYIL